MNKSNIILDSSDMNLDHVNSKAKKYFYWS